MSGFYFYLTFWFEKSFTNRCPFFFIYHFYFLMCELLFAGAVLAFNNIDVIAHVCASLVMWDMAMLCLSFLDILMTSLEPRNCTEAETEEDEEDDDASKIHALDRWFFGLLAVGYLFHASLMDHSGPGVCYLVYIMLGTNIIIMLKLQPMQQ